MRLRWFGETWNAPICDPRYQIDTPVNLKCMGCQALIEEPHRGVATAFVGYGSERLIDFVFEIGTGPDGTMVADAVAYHADCFVYGLLGPDAPAPDRINPSQNPNPTVYEPRVHAERQPDRATPLLAEGEPDYTLPSIGEES